MSRKHFLLIAVLTGLLSPANQFAQKSSGPRPPVERDDDMASIPEPAKAHDALNYDFIRSTFGRAPRTFFSKLGPQQPAWNVNAREEVPDSSWFTNRNHVRPLTPDEMRRGSTQGPQPDLSLPLTVLEGKTAGTSLGFGRTRDARGNIYFIKFDSAGFPEISTAAEVIGERFFYAMGYNVAAEWVIYVCPDQFQVDPSAKIWGKNGRQRRMTQEDVNAVLRNAARLPDGRYRAMASLLIPGKVKGPFKFYGTRKDDPNDLIPHEHRRELRGLGLFSAWLNHFDIRTGNTLDTYVAEGGRKYLRHYLLDFGSTLGSASQSPKVPRMGNSYVLDPEEMALPFFSLGLLHPRWREHPTSIKHASIGPFDSASFSPGEWKPVLPVPAFAFMDAADALWAGKIVMSFNDGQIRAAVQAGQLSDPEAEEYLVRTIIERQRKIGRFAFSRTNPLDQFKVRGKEDAAALEFQDLAVSYGFAEPPSTRYFYTLSQVGVEEAPKAIQNTSECRIPLRQLREFARNAQNPGALYVITIRARHTNTGFSDKWVKVYLERRGEGFELRGWEREA